MKKQSEAFKDWIRVIGAREHNLKNIEVSIPKNTLTVITGPSGSGKSSLAFDILFTEGKRRYMESLSSYARQFLGISKKPDVERIEGLCPSIAIEQKTVGSNPRSTVGTITEIHDYMRVLFARIGIPHCPICRKEIKTESAQQITAMIMQQYAGQEVMVVAPIVYEKKGEFTQQLLAYFRQGYYRFRIDGTIMRFKSAQDIEQLKLKKTFKHSIDLLLDNVEVLPQEQPRIAEAVERAFALAGGLCTIIAGEQQQKYSLDRMCVDCGIGFPELEPRLFSFNSPIGACTNCHGLGTVASWNWQSASAWSEDEYPETEGSSSEPFAIERPCPQCDGHRLNEQALAVTIGGRNIHQLGAMSVKELVNFFKQLTLSSEHAEIGKTLLQEVYSRLQFLFDVGLSYLSLNRSARTLSGGEGQRIRLATQIGSALSGVLYILDEPSIGLHQRDNDRLIATLKSLRDQGNTVLVVEHDTDTMKAADYLIDMGPAAGVHGGQVTAVGTPTELQQDPASLSGAYLSGAKGIQVPAVFRKPSQWLELTHLSKNNLRDQSVRIPLRLLCGVSGVSGSGKSSLVMQELVPALVQSKQKVYQAGMQPAQCELKGSELVSELVVVDQSPIGRTPRSNPATYLGIFDDIRALFAALPESNARGYTVGRFSFNVADGRCYECKGDGSVVVSMHFLPDVTMICKSCKGNRYNNQTLDITFKGKNIAQILQLTALEALEFFKAHGPVAKRLQLLCDVGLDYLALGQPATTLSGGEAQRIKLVKELAKRGSNTLYVLDEPTTGLHTQDVEKLLLVLNRLVEKGNSIVVIEHNLDLLKTCDYIIDMGPEGGDEGGYVVAAGTPHQIAACGRSHTGRYLAAYLPKV
jgi:excinuclease ABC subunit A